MTVNPKKMRPYDEPPRRRRTLIPDGIDSAAAGFLVAGAIWFVIAAGIGLFAVFLRLVTLELSVPLGVFDLSFELDRRRVDAAFANATVFGWLSNVGFAAVAFMTPRLVGRRLAAEKLLNLGLAIWNLTLAGGIALLYVLDIGVNGPLTALPWFVEGGLATGALIVTGAFLATAGAALLRAYISLWFAGIALLGLLGMTSLAAGLGILDAFFGLDGVPVALASAFIGHEIVAIWLLGMAFAILHYIVPRAAAQPLASGGIALLTWLTWLVLAPASGAGTLIDPSVPYFVTTAGAVATMLLLLPASLAAVNLSSTMRGRWALLFGRGTAAFAAVSIAFLLGHTLLEAIGALPSVTRAVGGTDWELGVFTWAAYGTFTLAALALADHAAPRALRRAWRGGRLSGAQLWLAFGGATLAGLALMAGGMAEGSLRAAGVAPDAVSQGVFWYRAVGFVGMIMVTLSALAFLANLFLSYTSGEPADYVVPGRAGAAAAGH
jgi:cytochrome c oxidase cbb3-type subunit 1